MTSKKMTDTEVARLADELAASSVAWTGLEVAWLLRATLGHDGMGVPSCVANFVARVRERTAADAAELTAILAEFPEDE